MALEAEARDAGVSLSALFDQHCRGSLSERSRAGIACAQTELFHLTGDNPYEVERAWKFVRSGSLILAPITVADLPSLHALMSRYADRPMDFRGATLIHLAQRESLLLSLTIDQDDFETHRIGGPRRFRICP